MVPLLPLAQQRIGAEGQFILARGDIVSGGVDPLVAIHDICLRRSRLRNPFREENTVAQSKHRRHQARKALTGQKGVVA